MAVKQTNKKSRTLNQKPSFKLKWWYVIPVVLLVAATGILILRFSNASSRTDRRFTGNGLEGGYATEGRGTEQRRLIGPQAGVSATVGSKSPFAGRTIYKKWACVRVFVDGGAERYWKIFFATGRNAGPLGDIGNGGGTKYFTTSGWATRCVN